MKASLLVRFTGLFFLLALLVPSTPAAADGGPYVRDVRKGRVAVHRPNYRTYKRPHTHGRLYRLLHR
jgi:hypothetical protein